MTYKIINEHCVENTETGICFPLVNGNADYEEYKRWLELGNTPQAADVMSTVEIWQRIKTERDRRIQNGGYKVGTKWYHSDTFSRTQQMGLVMMGTSLPAGIQWKTMDGSFVTMTPTLAGQIFGVAASSDIAIFGAAEAHRAAMDASADPSTYDFTGGWPPVFVA